MRTYLDYRLGCPGPGRVSVRVVLQTPAVLSSGLLPFAAPGGVVIAASQTGTPAVLTSGPMTVLFLRTPQRRLGLWSDEVSCPVRGDAEGMVKKLRLALRAFRSALRARGASRSNSREKGEK